MLYTVCTDTNNIVECRWGSLSSILVIVQGEIFIAVYSLWNCHKSLPFQVEFDFGWELQVISNKVEKEDRWLN